MLEFAQFSYLQLYQVEYKKNLFQTPDELRIVIKFNEKIFGFKRNIFQKSFKG